MGFFDTTSSQKILTSLLEGNYFDEGADNMDVAIRDLFTDIIHIAKKHNITFERLVERLQNAKEVFDEEEKR